jgi:CheY-like chemotaxis protein
LERVERAALRARSIVQQLLTFAHARRPDPQPVDIAALLQDTLDRLAANIAQEHVQVTLDIAPDLPHAHGDPDQLEQVLFNIVHNALQALAAKPPGTERLLNISARQLNHTLHLVIADSGPGIAPEDLPRIFEPFFTTRTVGQGTGLGLAIAHTIIQQHEGRLWVTSQAGQGTTFSIDLPPAAAPARQAEAAKSPAAPAPGARILLVEDEELVRLVVSRTLARHRYIVDAVETGVEALDCALAHDYALIISDLQMPGLDGAALYHRLQVVRPAMRWLIMTGDTMGERSHTFLEHTGLPALSKPFTHEQLLARVAECIGRDA